MIYGRCNEAAKAFEQAIAEDGKLPNPYNLWGRLLYREKQYTLSAEKFRQALAVDSTSIAALLSLSALNRLIGQPDDPGWFDKMQELVEADTDRLVKAQWSALMGSADQTLEKLAEAIQVTPDATVYARFCSGFPRVAPRGAIHRVNQRPAGD